MSMFSTDVGNYIKSSRIIGKLHITQISLENKSRKQA